MDSAARTPRKNAMSFKVQVGPPEISIHQGQTVLISVTGDRELAERHLGSAEACLSWIDKYGDRDGDGFQEYQTRSPVGYENMGWKDSGDSVVYSDGTLVKGPKALSELQGYVYDAWVRMAEIFDAFGKPERAQALRAKAAALFERFNEAFWDEELGFYAYALDGDKKKVLTVASNVGHCLWSEIVRPERAKKVVERLMAPDMWTGWGIRTLSALNPAFNPYNYQTGSVWPHDNSIIAMGFKSYGFAAEAAQIAHDISEAASHFMLQQLPELYTAFHRDETNFPVPSVVALSHEASFVSYESIHKDIIRFSMPEFGHGGHSHWFDSRNPQTSPCG
jgi:glycogen debranching enzyme